MSNYLNFSVQTEYQMKNWICMQLGYPLVQVEIADEQLVMCINDAVEEYTKYAIQEKRYLALNLEHYVPTDYDTTSGIVDLAQGGFNLATYTGGSSRVTSVFAMESSSSFGGMGGHNTLFSVTNSMANMGMFPIPGSSGGISGAWVNYELANQYVDLMKRMTASSFEFEFNERTQQLILTPDPSKRSMRGWICIGCNVLRPEDQQLGESWVKRYALACAKVVIGNIRAKYEGTQLLGGGAISTTFRDEGLTEKETLLEELKSTFVYCDFFLG